MVTGTCTQRDYKIDNCVLSDFIVRDRCDKCLNGTIETKVSHFCEV